MLTTSIFQGSALAQTDDYPYSSHPYCARYLDPDDVDPWKFWKRECTSFVAWRMNRDAGVTALNLPAADYPFYNYMGGEHLGHAGNWDNALDALGYVVDGNARVGDIAQWDGSEVGGVGHVAYVVAVNGDGSVEIEDYNWNLNCQYRRVTLSGANLPPRYIHVNSNPSVYHLVGDWNGDGVPKMWTFTSGTWNIPADDNGGVAKIFGFGAIDGAIPVVGDWDGDNVVNYGVFVPNDVAAGSSMFYLDVDRVGGSDWNIPLAGLYPMDLPVAGDWDGDGDDDIGAYNPVNATFYLALIDPITHLRQDLTPFVFQGGQAGDWPIAGKWDGGAADDVGLFRAQSPWPQTNNFIVRSNGGYYDLANLTGNGYGDSVDTPLIADWDQSGYDSIGVYHQADGSAYWRVPLWPKLGDPTPATPSNLTVTGTTSASVSLAWDDVSGESGYRVYKWNGASFILHAELGSNVTSFIDTGLACASQFFYEVSAYNAAGESSHAGWVMGTTSACPPAAPSNLQVTGATASSVALGWADVSGETGYRVYKWNGATFVLLAQLGSNVTAYTDSGLSCGSQYFYELSAYNAAGESAHTAWVMGTTQSCGGNVMLSSGVPYWDSLPAGNAQQLWNYYYIDVPSGASKLEVVLDSLSADADLYVNPFAQPDLDTYVCRPHLGGSQGETCPLDGPNPGTWWVGVNNWATGTINFRITATYCTASSSILLSNETIDTTAVYEACDTITTGSDVTVAASGDVTFRAGSTIAFGNGFIVEPGATLSARIENP